MKKIHIEFSDERLITPSGLVFVGQILGKSSFVKKINRAPISKDYLQKQIKNGDVLLTYIGMLCQEKPQYEAVREMMDDPDYYKYALGISYAIPSAETLRQRFDMIVDSLRKDIQQANVDMLREMHIEPTALDNGFVPVDIDVTPFDNSKSNKEGVSVPTRVLTDIHQLWHISAQKDTSSILNCGLGNSTARKKLLIS